MIPKLLAASALLALPANGAVTWSETFHFTSGVAIPDDSLIGVADSRQIISTITHLLSVRVSLETSGGWNGDLYAYLAHATGICILLNRPGRTAAEPDGSGSSGMHVSFDDEALEDSHLAIPALGYFTGTYQPDGRDVLPEDSYDHSPRSTTLSTFSGMDANGEWSLFILDASPGGSATLQRWSLTVTGVPEPTTPLLCGLGAVALWRRRRPHV